MIYFLYICVSLHNLITIFSLQVCACSQAQCRTCEAEKEAVLSAKGWFEGPPPDIPPIELARFCEIVGLDENGRWAIKLFARVITFNQKLMKLLSTNEVLRCQCISPVLYTISEQVEN